MQSSEYSLSHFLSPTTLAGALIYGLVFFFIALALATVVRVLARRTEKRLTDVTALRFATALTQVLIYGAAFVVYAHLIPELRALGTALLAGVSVVSLVLGLAAQSTLGNVISGLSIILYRSLFVGDNVQITTPKGLATATIESLSLGYTLLRDSDGAEVIVPNSVMASNVVVRIGRRESRT